MNISFQDNNSVIKMENNGRNSCTGKLRHINIKYVWVEDMVDKKKIRIMYCLTWLILGDYSTKPLQCSLFRFYMGIVIGHRHSNKILGDTRYSLKERVTHIIPSFVSENMNKMAHTEKPAYVEVVKE